MTEQGEPGGMVRGKLFAVENGWVWVTPQMIHPEMIGAFQEYWAEVSPDKRLLIIPDTDLLVGGDGRLFVKDFAFAFPEEIIDG